MGIGTERRVLVALLVTLTLPATAVAQAAGRNGPPKPLFTWGDAALVGGFAVATLAARPLDRSFALRLQQPHVQENRFFGVASTIVRNIAEPGGLIIGPALYVGGRLGGNRDMADLGLHGTEALAVGSAVGFVLKGTIGRARPYVHTDPNPNDYQLWRGFRYGGDYQSLPSGHSIAAFAAAAAVTSETHRYWRQGAWLVGTTMYGGASLVGLSRMYNNRHWASDVLFGAAVGTMAGLKVVRYHHSHPDNPIDRWLLAFTLTPAENGGQKLGLSIVPQR